MNVLDGYSLEYVHGHWACCLCTCVLVLLSVKDLSVAITSNALSMLFHMLSSRFHQLINYLAMTTLLCRASTPSTKVYCQFFVLFHPFTTTHIPLHTYIQLAQQPFSITYF